MKLMERPQHLPDANRLSMVAAIILLSYAMARFINLPISEFSLQLPGVFLTFKIEIRTLVVVMVAGLTAAGADWLLLEHPDLGKRSTLEHWLVPALTSMVISLPLFQLPLGPIWWAGILLGAAFLMLVLLAEYLVVNPDDPRQPPAAAGLTILAFALYLLMAVSLRTASIRLFLTIPALTIAGWLVCLRTLHLRLHGIWALLQASLIAVILGEMATALFYMRLSPISFGLALIGAAYGLTSLIAGVAEGNELRQAAIEPGIVSLVLWVAAFWFRS